MAPLAYRMATLHLYSCVSAVVEITALLLIRESEKRQRRRQRKNHMKYPLLTEFEVRTVSYGPSFFPFIYSRMGINQRDKTRICNLQHGPRKRG